MDYPQQSTIISVVIRGYATNNKCKGNPQNTTLRAAGRQGSGAANGRRRLKKNGIKIEEFYGKINNN